MSSNEKENCENTDENLTQQEENQSTNNEIVPAENNEAERNVMYSFYLQNRF